MVLPKIVAIGIYNSDLAVKNIKVTKNRKTTMFEIELPIENGGVSYVEAEERPITTDFVICAKPGQTRHSRLPYKCYYIHMILEEGKLYDALMRCPVYVIPESVQRYREVFAALCKHYDLSLENDLIRVQSLILELIYLLNNDSKKQVYAGKSKSNNRLAINKVVDYIAENLTSDLSLEAVAAVASISPIHFHNCFKSAIGKTLREYVEEQRIKKATNLIVSTDWTLTRISNECGFSSQAYFSHVFKRRMGKTPREYAKAVFDEYEKELS